MNYYFSPSKLGFYTEDVHGDKMPQDCVAVTQEEYDNVFSSFRLGYQIAADANGKPTFVEVEPIEQPVLTPAEKLAAAGLTVEELKSLLDL
jgi:hypothetical protein